MLTATASEPAPPIESPPSPELLMYLGEFEDAGGEFVDPMVLEETPAKPDSEQQPGVPQADGENDDEAAPRSA